MNFAILFLLLAAALSAAEMVPKKLADAARSQIGKTISYDPAYKKLKYPQGDVPQSTGVCSDVVVRALREQGIDLQQLVHEDMTRNFSAYPNKWGLTKPDPNIDHRRVPNLMTYFQRQGLARKITKQGQDFSPGDIVTWDLGRGITHIGMVSDRRSTNGTPLIIHNIGRGAREEDVLFQFQITGHYRWK
jgi:uncharacterized protein